MELGWAFELAVCVSFPVAVELALVLVDVVPPEFAVAVVPFVSPSPVWGSVTWSVGGVVPIGQFLLPAPVPKHPSHDLEYFGFIIKPISWCHRSMESQTSCRYRGLATGSKAAISMSDSFGHTSAKSSSSVIKLHTLST